MKPEFYIGLAIGFTPWLLLLLVFVIGKLARPMTMDASNNLLAERNAIGERQAAALEAIAECFCEADAEYIAEMMQTPEKGGDQ